ncbi:MAG TPA: class E sortase, partial [Actinomycetota bacterium]|nr:class E sortase [Actinomycetota bacterium]
MPLLRPSLPSLSRRARTALVVALTVAVGLSALAASGLLALRQTNSVERSAQDALRRKFITGLAAAPVQVVNEPAAEGKVPLPVQFIPERSQPSAGDPVAVLRIPAIDVDKVVVEGIGDQQLRTAPGHYPGTALPGQGGTFAVAGHRATYGAPFFKLDRLELNDTIHVTTGRGDFVYTVTGRKVRLPSQNASLSSYGRERLVLTTTAPSMKDDRRLVVTALLQDHTTRTFAKVELPAGDAGEDYAEESVPDLQLNPLGRLAATNVTPRVVNPARPSEAAAPQAPAPPPPPP